MPATGRRPTGVRSADLSARSPVVPPIATAKAMFERAELFDLEPGGRFDRRSACVPMRVTNAAAADSGEPIGGFWVRWHDPTEEQATPL